MIIDTSAFVAVLRREPAAQAVRSALRDHVGRSVLMSAATYLELGIVVDSRGDAVASRGLDDSLERFGVLLVPVDVEQARLARQAYRDFGRGSGHPARLNVGDCFSYALASVRREPLLFVGDDFTHTDVRSVL